MHIKPTPDQETLNDHERAERYVAACESAGNGSRNTGLNDLGFALRKNFILTEPEHRQLCLNWSQRCDPPMNQSEAGKTIRSAWVGAERAGVVGTGSDEPAKGGAERPHQAVASKASQPTTLKSPSQSVFERIDAMATGRIRDVGWPWRYLSAFTKTFYPGTVTLLCAPPGAAKSLVVLMAMHHWLEREIPVSVLEMEEDETFHLTRYLAQLAGNSNLLDDEWLRSNGDAGRAAVALHQAQLDKFGACVYAKPQSTHCEYLLDWVEARFKGGDRVVIIDPITAKEDGEQVWVSDKQMSQACARLTVKYQASLLLVTHPCKSSQNIDISRNPLADFSGGSSWGNFCQTALMLNRVEEKRVKCSKHGLIESNPVNRIFHLRKTRNGKAELSKLGYYFDKSKLSLTERGLLV